MRGEFGVWLVGQRKAAGYRSAGEAVAAMKRSEGYAISVSEWAEFEAGTRRPSAERRAALEGFLGAAAPSRQVTPPPVDLAAVIAAQTEAIERQTQVLDRLVDLLEGKRESPFLGRFGAAISAVSATLSDSEVEAAVAQINAPRGDASLEADPR